MNKLYLFVPQWQDSGVSKKLYKGAYSLKKYIQNISQVVFMDVKVDTIEKPVLSNKIFGYSIIIKQLSEIAQILKKNKPDKIVSIGGGCGIEVPIISYLRDYYSNLQVFWFDAHGDLNSPESSTSKHFHGMPLRFIVENQNNEISKNIHTIAVNNVHLIGTRDLDVPEEEYIIKNNINRIHVGVNYWVDICKATNISSPAYIHIDLDVINPIEYRNVKCPAANGLCINELVESIKYIKRKMNIVGLSILENTETNQNKIKKIEDILYEAINV